MNEGYRLRLTRFSVRYKDGKGSREHDSVNRVFLFMLLLILSVYLFCGNFLSGNDFREIVILFLVGILVLSFKITVSRYNSKLKKDVGLGKEIYVKFEDKDIYFYNAGHQNAALRLRYRNNDFLYKKSRFGDFKLVVDGTEKIYHFYISKKYISLDYEKFCNDLEENYIKKIKVSILKIAGKIFVFLYLGTLGFFLVY